MQRPDNVGRYVLSIRKMCLYFTNRLKIIVHLFLEFVSQYFTTLQVFISNLTWYYIIVELKGDNIFFDIDMVVVMF